MECFLRYVDDLLELNNDWANINLMKLDWLMVHITPFLRTEMLTAQVSSTGSVAGFNSNLDPEMVPRMLLVLYLIAASALASGMHQVSFQSLSAIYNAFKPLAFLFAYMDSPVKWRDRYLIKFPSTDRGDMYRELIYLSVNLLDPCQKPLKELLNGIVVSGCLNRVSLLKCIAQMVFGNIIPVQSNVAVIKGSDSPIKCSMQRVALRLFRVLLDVMKKEDGDNVCRTICTRGIKKAK